MEQKKKSILMKSIIITVILLTVIILTILIMQIFVIKQDSTTSNSTNNEQLVNTNQIEQYSNNEQQQQVETNTNEEQTAVIIPIIDENSNQTTEEDDEYLISTSYYYNQLNNNGKIIYDNLKQNKDKLITGTYIFDFDTQFNTLLHTPNGEQELNEAFQSAWNAFSYDESDLFYIDVTKMNLIKEQSNIGGILTYRVSIGPAENTNYLKEGFSTEEQITEAQSYLENIVSQIVEQTAENTDRDKAKRIHDWLISIIEYDDSETNKNRFHIYGALHDRKAVCEGYARSFKYLMEKVGVPCVLVSGTATNSEGVNETHAWNYIQIDNKWYAVDVTWDDPVVIGGGEVDDEVKYRYFLKGSRNFNVDHKEEGIISENSMEFKFPTLEENNY